ncbi:MAG: bifunctional response regulator/alkaline phosphatase family protein [Fluviicola sp.]|nr:bifunctional response regulator/alkaline phosphatase family protein [Fluviicola sp.]
MQAKILWADDEMEFLKPHVLFLESKGYHVELINNGSEAVEKCQENNYDIVFLDENMPGISGLEALTRIKEIHPHLPVVMITKSEEESIMEDAIGGKIADYLIKPVNPNQLLLSLKKNLDHRKLVSQKTNSNYQQEFRQLGMQLSSRLDAEEWKEVFKKLTYWDLEFKGLQDQGMREILNAQRREANDLFCRFIENNYEDWFNGQEEAPEMVHHLLKERVFPMLNEPVYLLVIDNLRYDQWQVLKPIISNYFTIEKEDIVFSILPTATHYARNALFAGLMPSEIEKRFPQHWLNEEDEGGKNMHEAVFLEGNLKRNGKNVKWSYNKITNLDAGKRLLDQFNNYKDNQLNVIVYNFVDMLSHARTEMDMIKELAADEAAYRSLTVSWFEHSPLQEMLKKMAAQKVKVVITTDHGTVRVTNPVKIVGDRATNTNLRYKTGRNLSYKEKEVFTIRHPEKVGLPKSNISSEFVFTREHDYFVYPNNYNHFVNYYNDTFQHGGISMEEIMIPFVILQPK